MVYAMRVNHVVVLVSMWFTICLSQNGPVVEPGGSVRHHRSRRHFSRTEHFPLVNSQSAIEEPQSDAAEEAKLPTESDTDGVAALLATHTPSHSDTNAFEVENTSGRVVEVRTEHSTLGDSAPDDAGDRGEGDRDEGDWDEAGEWDESGGDGGLREDKLTELLRVVESQHLLGGNCSAGTDLHLGEGVVDRYAQDKFRVEAEVAVSRANLLTRLWKYASTSASASAAALRSEYLLHAFVFSMVEFDADIFAAGNCYDQFQYKDYWLFCPYAYRLPEGPILVKDLAVEYKYLSNTSEWFYIARKSAERVIRENRHFSRGFHTYTFNATAHTEREPDDILTVRYEDGKWSKPYFDCGGGNIWMLTYTVPFFGVRDGKYHFKGTSGIDIDLRRVDIDQCPLPAGSKQLNIFAASDKCKKRTTKCEAVAGLGFRRGSYKCVCRRGFFFPDTRAEQRYYNGSVVEEEFEKLLMGRESAYSAPGAFQCLRCAEGCDACVDARPCVVTLNWPLRTAILALTAAAILCLPAAVAFTCKFGHVKVVRAASPALLRFIALGAFFIYTTVVVAYPSPSVLTCTARVWLREVGFALTYGALMLKTWRISVVFRVRGARAVRISDAALLRRLAALVGAAAALLAVRTLVAAPALVQGRTADGLKAPLCRTDWWDHAFSAMEALFLVWGIRLCIVVRKAPSAFNESRFISMAIYNEFLLSLFLNVSMLFLQSPANPDLLYIIFFAHSQLTVTMLLGLIFGSKVWLVWRARGRPEEEDGSIAKKAAPGKFLAARGRPPPPAADPTTGATAEAAEAAAADAETAAAALDAEEELLRVQAQLGLLRERSLRAGDARTAALVAAMQEASRSPQHNSVPPPAPQTEEPSSTPGPGARSPPLWRQASPEALRGSSPGAGPPRGQQRGREHSSLKSGHARTHAIVINLDDRTRFTEEVTV